MNPAFPEGYSEWRKVEPRELIDAQLIKEPVQKNVHKAIRKQAKDADTVVIATDYDREGELIGLEALEEILDVNPKLAENVSLATGVKRARYSALTKEEIDEAFTNLVELSEPLARAGEARQDIDLIWGATLTRFVSLATGRLGSQFLSVGRVQSPTLAIVVERELERRAHVPKPFWEVWAAFEHPDGVFTAHHKVDKFWEEAEAKAALENTALPGRRQVGRVAGATRASRRRRSTRRRSRAPHRRSASRRPARCASPRTSTWTASSPIRARTTPSTRSRSPSGSCCVRSRRCRRSRRRRRSPSVPS